jgi:hypothetical protein
MNGHIELTAYCAAVSGLDSHQASAAIDELLADLVVQAPQVDWADLFDSWTPESAAAGRAHAGTLLRRHVAGSCRRQRGRRQA